MPDIQLIAGHEADAGPFYMAWDNYVNPLAADTQLPDTSYAVHKGQGLRCRAYPFGFNGHIHAVGRLLEDGGQSFQPHSRALEADAAQVIQDGVPVGGVQLLRFCQQQEEVSGLSELGWTSSSHLACLSAPPCTLHASWCIPNYRMAKAQDDSMPVMVMCSSHCLPSRMDSTLTTSRLTLRSCWSPSRCSEGKEPRS